MKTIINYVIETNLGLVLFVLFYRVVLSNETNFKFKRQYTIGVIISSLLFPLFHLNVFSENVASMQGVIPAYLLPTLMVGKSNEISQTAEILTIQNIVVGLYLIVSTLLLLRFTIQLSRILRLFNTHSGYKIDNKYTIIELNATTTSFSFFRYIVIGGSDDLTKTDREAIINHEKVHSDKFHSLDILLTELLIVLFWYNPIVYTYKKLISSIHEFQADEKAVEKHDVNQYCNLLARVALMSADFKLANHFNNSLTLKRINMMKTIKRKLNVWKMAASALIAGGFFFLAACQDQLTEATELAKSSTMALNVPAEVQKQFDELQASNPSKKFIIVEPTTEEGKRKVAELKQTEIASVNVITPTAKPNEPIRTFMIVEMNDQVKQIAENSKGEDDVYTVVEQRAEYPGGAPKLYEYLTKNITYPVDARTQNITGNVFVEFIVMKDGSISNVRVIKGVSPSLDKEAVRLVQGFPEHWIPGQQNGKAVNVKFVLPIQFSLGAPTQDEASAKENAEQNSMSKVVVVGNPAQNK